MLRLRTSFAFRLYASVLLALALTGVAFIWVVSGALRDEALRSGLHDQRVQAEALRARALDDPARVQFELSSIVKELGSQPGVLRAAVLNVHGITLAGAGSGPLHDHSRLGRFAVRPGYLAGSVQPARAGVIEHLQFVAALPVDERYGYVLVIDRDTAALNAQVSVARRSMALAGVPAAALCALLAWILGGRALSARHKHALERATRDALTDLGNHRAFEEELARAAATARRGGGDFALIAFDIDHFKVLNDLHGHQHGDDVLRRVASAVEDCCRVEDRAFRVGGDEFTVILPRAGELDAVTVATRIQRRLAAAGVAASTGLSVTRGGMRDSRLLREEADASLFEAKRAQLPYPIAFSAISHQVTVRTPAKVAAVRRLIDERAVDAAFQPIWDLDSGRLLGVEGLARPAEALGLDGPAEAFDVAEQTGAVRALDRVCLERIFGAARRLPEDVLLFVNIAPATLDAGHDGLGWVARAARSAGLDPGRVVVEITERLGARVAAVIAGADRLRALGFRLALDDVGAGDAGLTRLRSFKVEFVKVDRAVVTGARHDPGSRAVLLAVSAFAKETGACVIAEGIEDREVLESVRSLGLDTTAGSLRILGGQGYGLVRPQPSLAKAIETPAELLLSAARPA